MKKYRIEQLKKEAFYIEEYKEITIAKKNNSFCKWKPIYVKEWRWSVFNGVKYQNLVEAIDALFEIDKYPILHEINFEENINQENYLHKLRALLEGLKCDNITTLLKNGKEEDFRRYGNAYFNSKFR